MEMYGNVYSYSVLEVMKQHLNINWWRQVNMDQNNTMKEKVDVVEERKALDHISSFPLAICHL